MGKKSITLSIPATMETLWIGKPTYTSTSSESIDEDDYYEITEKQENHDYDDIPDTFYDEKLGREVETYKGLWKLVNSL